jgi:glutathione synthase/RimK-type ligase-like ATP-grasp enzyme
MCRSYRYQTTGYYVSLLAEARGHKPLPNVPTMLDMKSQTIVRFVSEDLDDLIQKSLTTIKSPKFTLSIYFGQNLAKHYAKLSLALFKLFPSPFLRAQFLFTNNKWQLQSIGPIAANDIPEEHRPFVIEVAREYFESNRSTVAKHETPRFDIAILYNPEDENKPSNAKAIQRFIKAAESLDLGVELIQKDDYGRIAEFDALFIRETTSVNHHTYRFARRAVAEGLVVVDDPDSILKCANKVYLAELLEKHKIATPKTQIVSSVDQVESIVQELGLPCILKQPDSAFSLGVLKASTKEQLRQEVERLLDDSDLIIAQQFLPTAFDWRVGVFEGQPLFVCKYHMASNHWQIIKRDPNEESDFGAVETMPVETAPAHVVKAALKAANLIGDGLYGVDLKEVDGKCYVIEVNDNPNIDAGFEDSVLKEELYLRVMRIILKRIERLKEGHYKL